MNCPILSTTQKHKVDRDQRKLGIRCQVLTSEMITVIKESTNENSKNEGVQGHRPPHRIEDLIVLHHCKISITITMGHVEKAIVFTTTSL